MIVLFGLLAAAAASASRWSEQDESDRISAIIAAEKRAFDEEMKSQQQARYRIDQLPNYGSSDLTGQGEFDRRYRSRRPTTIATTTEAPSYEALSSSEEAALMPSWCYLCASPLALLSHNSRKAVQQFLDIRRTAFPKGATTRECISPRNFSALLRQDCKHRFCQTLVMMDHEEGTSFVMRGCAEHFGAIHTELLEAREDNTCVRLHDKLDIRECICRERKSCYAGRERSATSLLSLLPASILVTIYRLAI